MIRLLNDLCVPKKLGMGPGNGLCRTWTVKVTSSESVVLTTYSLMAFPSGSSQNGSHSDGS